MKKILNLALAALLLSACNNQSKTETAEVTPPVIPEQTVPAPPEPAVVTTEVYSPKEGDVIFREKKLMVYKDGKYVVAEKDVTLDGDVIVKKDGEVVNKDKKVKLEEGEAVTKAGRFVDKAGKWIDNAWNKTKDGVSTAAEKTGDAVEKGWDATKKGVKKAAEKTGEGLEKAGEKVKEAVH